jgi:diadenylate cyclase
VFGDFRQLGVIAILIIFQPELRSALEKIGGTTYEGIQNINHAVEKPTEASSHKVIDAIASAAQDLSKINYGALIVIERENSLDQCKESGAYLDSAVTADALKSIFYKGATLHDGAVIIRDGRIDYARCVLPMTERVDISSELGTRHRAALGTTEKTDAIVVIVSEESGIISLSIDGELERGFTYATLSARLEELLNPKQNGKKNNNRRKKRRKNLGAQKKKTVTFLQIIKILNGGNYVTGKDQK